MATVGVKGLLLVQSWSVHGLGLGSTDDWQWRCCVDAAVTIDNNDV